MIGTVLVYFSISFSFFCFCFGLPMNFLDVSRLAKTAQSRGHRVGGVMALPARASILFCAWGSFFLPLVGSRLTACTQSEALPTR